MKPENLPATSPALQMIEFWQQRQEAIPPRLVERAKYCLLDAIGCGLFGSRQSWGEIMTSEVLADGSRGPCTVLGSRQTAAAPQAALCNGTAIHGFELDDLLPASIVHPGTIVVPAALAAAEEADASGLTLLRGLVAGYEAISRLSLGLGLEPSHRGFHKTSVVGPVAAAVACGVVAGLDSEQMICAAGLACSTGSGIKAFAGGSGGGMVKRMHAGRAAEAGVRMTRLARRGFTGPRAAIDGRYGLLEVYAGHSAEPQRLTEGLGEAWAMDGLWVKVYPVCGWIQGVVQLLTEMRGSGPLALERVDKVIVGTSEFAVRNNANPAPSDAMEAQYSIPYCAAVALSGDPGDPNVFCAPAIHDPARLSFARRVQLRVDPESEAVYPARFGSRIELHYADGSVKEGGTLDPHGTAADPCTDDELVAKFDRLAALSAPGIDRKAVARMVSALDSLRSVRALSALLQAC